MTDAKHCAEVERLRARVAELEAELEATKAVDIEAYRHLSRLHEIATERTVQLEAELEATKKANLRVRLSALAGVFTAGRHS